MVTLLMVMTQLAAAEDLGPRLTVLHRHLERLHAITVASGLEDEKAAKLAELKGLLDSGAESVEAFNELYRKMDAVRTWLLAHSLHKPARAQGSFEETEDAWVLRNPQLELRLARADLSVTVQTANEAWRMAPCDHRDVEAKPPFSLRSAETQAAEAFHTSYSTGMLLNLAGFPDAPDFELVLGIHLAGTEAVFELTAPEDGLDFRLINWPKPFELGNTADDYSLVPFMQGALIPGDWPEGIHQRDLCNSRSLYLPMWGQIQQGHGVLAILETSDDAGAEYEHTPGGPTRIQPRWYAGLGRLRYPRRIRYAFQDEATHVTLAKRYRRYVEETGRFVPLEVKRLRTPGLNEVIGRPVIHVGALYHFVQEASLFNKDRIENNHALGTFDELAAQLRALKDRGVDDAYVHLDGWGFYGYDNGHPDVLPVGEEQGGWDGLRRFADTCEELGYFFAVHDQYRDFYYNAVSFDDRLAATRLDGSREEHATWCGGPQTILSAVFAPGCVRRNHDLFAEHGIRVRGAYLDVFSVVPLEESAQRAHPMTRTECARARRECFDLLRARGYVVSSEEPTDYLMPTLDLVHHAPYPTAPNIGGGEPVAVPVPLFNLVYHGAVLMPWSMSEDGGWGIPNGDAGRLHCLLNAGLPYVGTGADAKAIERVQEAAALAQRCGTLEMVNHEFLNESRRRQRTTFSDGTRVTVDFETKEHRIDH